MTDIHTWFGLSYSNYLVLNRSVLQSMPESWQHDFVATLEVLHQQMGEEMRERMPSSYQVKVLARPTEWITPYETCESCEGEGEVMIATCEAGYHSEKWVTCPDCDGEQEIVQEHRRETPEEVGFIDDPIPHYNRGRTVIDFKTGLEKRHVKGN